MALQRLNMILLSNANSSTQPFFHKHSEHVHLPAHSRHTGTHKAHTRQITHTHLYVALPSSAEARSPARLPCPDGAAVGASLHCALAPPARHPPPPPPLLSAAAPAVIGRRMEWPTLLRWPRLRLSLLLPLPPPPLAWAEEGRE